MTKPRAELWGLGADGGALGNPLACWLAHPPELVTALSLGVRVLEGLFPLIPPAESTAATALWETSR